MNKRANTKPFTVTPGSELCMCPSCLAAMPGRAEARAAVLGFLRKRLRRPGAGGERRVRG